MIQKVCGTLVFVSSKKNYVRDRKKEKWWILCKQHSRLFFILSSWKPSTSHCNGSSSRLQYFLFKWISKEVTEYSKFSVRGFSGFSVFNVILTYPNESVIDCFMPKKNGFKGLFCSAVIIACLAGIIEK